MALVPCDGCRRHVRASEDFCPFCKAVRTATSIVVVAASTMAIAGCDVISPGVKYGGPPGGYTPPPEPDAAPLTVPAPDAFGPPTPSASVESPRLAPDAGRVHAPATKYGLPPSDRGNPNNR